MAASPWLAAILPSLAVALLAGCAAGPQASGPGAPGDGTGPVLDTGSPSPAAAPPSPSGDPGPGPGTPAAAAAAADAPGLRMSGCIGWSAGPTVPGPRPSARTPPGWEEDPPGATSSVGLLALDCARVSVGPFERPLRLLVETTTSFLAPETCLGSVDAVTVFLVPNTVWLEDAEVAGHLASTFGLDAIVRPLSTEVQQAGGADVHSWSWGLEGQPESRVQVTDAGSDQAQDSLPDQRLFWAAGGRLARLDLDLTLDGPETAPALVEGTVQPPMLLHDAGRPFAWTGMWYNAGSVEGRLTLYEDFACEHPVA